jgi:hypothetical protein
VANQLWCVLSEILGVQLGGTLDNGPVHLAYNPSFSAYFFSQNSIFLS